MKHYRFFVFLILICAFLVRPVSGCSIPVFRYALERWGADYYDGVVIHKGPLSDDDPAVALLQGEKAEFLNLRISPIDLESSAEDDLRSLLGGAVPETLPAIVLWYPLCKGRAAPFWTGRFTPETVEALIASPKRLQLAQRLSDGQTAVWVFIESGNPVKDKAAMQLLERELATATKELKQAASELAEELDMPGLSYEFSILPVSRSDPKEQMLLEMLLKSEPDLGDYADEPIVFPVFGRGRALYALASEGINTDTIRETIYFITGPCGCEIKMMNPGVDLLIAENWDAAVMQFYQEFYEMDEEPLPELTGVFPEEPAEADLNAQGEVVTAAVSEPPRPPSAPAVEIPERKVRGLGVMGTAAVSLAAVMAAVGLGTLAVIRRNKKT